MIVLDLETTSWIRILHSIRAPNQINENSSDSQTDFFAKILGIGPWVGSTHIWLSSCHKKGKKCIFDIKWSFLLLDSLTYSEVPNRRACLLRFFRFSFHPACNFSCNKRKIPPCSFIDLLSNFGTFFQPCSFILVCSSIRNFRVHTYI